MTRTPMRSDQPRVFLIDDGRHAAYLYQFEPPVTPEDVAFSVDQLANSGIDTLLLSVCLEGGAVTYDSRVAPKWGDNVDMWTHSVWYRAARNLKQMLDDGHDPLQLVIDRCRERGLWFYAGSWVNFEGADRETAGGLGRKTDFVYDNPQFQVGAEEDPRAAGVNPCRFSFLHEAVRERRFVLFEELLRRYETDGIEMDLADHVPLSRFDEVERLAPVLTDWLRRLRRVADEAQQSQNRRKRLLVRIPADPEAWAMLGYDVTTWVGEGIVDGLICLPGLMHASVDTGVDLSAAVQVAAGSDCLVMSGFAQTLARQTAQQAPPPMVWAAAANAYDQGADAFGLADACTFPDGWPWTAVQYDTWRLLDSPDLLATADKQYRVPSRGVRPPPAWLPGGDPPLPRALEVGEPLRLELRMADDVAHWQQLGRVESVRLAVRITAIEACLNSVEISLNGRILPESLRQLNDLNYRLTPGGSVSPYGYVYEFDLPAEYYPQQGSNTLTILLRQRDPNISLPFEVYDVDCHIRYRRHRNFRREPQ
jgi:hypothetical protein